MMMGEWGSRWVRSRPSRGPTRPEQGHALRSTGCRCWWLAEFTDVLAEQAPLVAGQRGRGRSCAAAARWLRGSGLRQCVGAVRCQPWSADAAVHGDLGDRDLGQAGAQPAGARGSGRPAHPDAVLLPAPGRAAAVLCAAPSTPCARSERARSTSRAGSDPCRTGSSGSRIPGSERYHAMLAELCDHEPELVAQMRAKQPSSGMLALAIGLAWHDFERCVLSGFSFEITHAYADNPLIAERGSASSKHAETDIALLRHLSKRFGTIYTTEPAVTSAPAFPCCPEGAARAAPAAADAGRANGRAHRMKALKRLSNISKYGLGARARERKQADKEQTRQRALPRPRAVGAQRDRRAPQVRVLRGVPRASGIQAGPDRAAAAREGGRGLRRVQAALCHLRRARGRPLGALPWRAARHRGARAA